MSIPCSHHSVTNSLALWLAYGLRLELDLTPKPGLVDARNSGSHDDLSYAILLDSVDLVAGYFLRCARALEAGAPVEQLRTMGCDTEARMFDRFNTNTHRGAIFLGGLLLAGVHRAVSDDVGAIRAGIRTVARELFDVRVPQATTGAAVRARFGAGGIITEALTGLPSLFEQGIPAIELGERLGLGPRDTQLLVMGRLMQRVEDTTTLRRCGELGLCRLRDDGGQLERLLRDGKDPIPYLLDLDRSYCEARMTMGGVADLLAVTLAWRNFATRVDDQEHPLGVEASRAAKMRAVSGQDQRHLRRSAGQRTEEWRGYNSTS